MERERKGRAQEERLEPPPPLLTCGAEEGEGSRGEWRARLLAGVSLRAGGARRIHVMWR